MRRNAVRFVLVLAWLDFTTASLCAQKSVELINRESKDIYVVTATDGRWTSKVSPNGSSQLAFYEIPHWSQNITGWYRIAPGETKKFTFGSRFQFAAKDENGQDIVDVYKESGWGLLYPQEYGSVLVANQKFSYGLRIDDERPNALFLSSMSNNIKSMPKELATNQQAVFDHLRQIGLTSMRSIVVHEDSSIVLGTKTLRLENTRDEKLFYAIYCYCGNGGVISGWFELPARSTVEQINVPVSANTLVAIKAQDRFLSLPGQVFSWPLHETKAFKILLGMDLAFSIKGEFEPKRMDEQSWRNMGFEERRVFYDVDATMPIIVK